MVFASRLFALLALATNAASVLLLGTWRVRGSHTLAAVREHALSLAFAVALVATLGSLYYGEWVGLEPCRLCWYQRIAMYPLTVVLGVAALRRDVVTARLMAWPLVAIGGLISTYHYLQQHFPDLASGACSATAPCTAAYVWEFGFISIPYMALSAFIAIGLLLGVAARNSEQEHDA